jgi:hypothetical protein
MSCCPGICSLQIRPPLKQRKYAMTWLPLDSKMFLSLGYDATQRILYLSFHSGDVYRYFQFSQDHYQLFLAAESKGRYFLSHIRNCLPYDRMAKLQVA